MLGLEKAIVRVTTVSDNTARIQRLYDYGSFFKLSEETLTDKNQIDEFLNTLVAMGGHETRQWDYVDEDDFTPRHAVLYEYTVSF